MSIQSEIERISGNVASAYSVLSAKGATLPESQNSDNLASTIQSLEMVEAEAMSIETIWEICGYNPLLILPRGYTLLDYIESSGTQYIDTGFMHNQDTRVVMDVQLTATPSAHAWVFGGRISTSSATIGVFWYKNNSLWAADYAGNSQRFSFSDIETLDRLNIDYNKNVLTINGSTNTFTEETFQSTANLVLLAVNTVGTVANYASAKLYSCQIWDNGTLIRQYAPCIDPNGNVGLYDTVEGVFYGNAGTGTFTAGNELVECEYIESSGTQYIDTGFLPDNNSRIVAEISGWPTSETSKALWGTQDSSVRYDMFITSGGVYRSYYGTTYSDVSSVSVSGKMTIDRNGTEISLNEYSAISTDNTFSCTYPLCLFAHNNSGTVGKKASLLLYSCQIYDNGTLVRDFIPMVAGDEYGLYDKANNRFYTNAGSGSFTGK